MPTVFARYHKQLSNKFPDSPVSILRCDHAPEFIKGDLELYCMQTGITTDEGCPYEPELNGAAERKEQDILLKMRTLLLDSGLPVNK